MGEKSMPRGECDDDVACKEECVHISRPPSPPPPPTCWHMMDTAKEFFGQPFSMQLEWVLGLSSRLIVTHVDSASVHFGYAVDPVVC